MESIYLERFGNITLIDECLNDYPGIYSFHFDGVEMKRDAQKMIASTRAAHGYPYHANDSDEEMFLSMDIGKRVTQLGVCVGPTMSLMGAMTMGFICSISV